MSRSKEKNKNISKERKEAILRISIFFTLGQIKKEPIKDTKGIFSQKRSMYTYITAAFKYRNASDTCY